ncbi:MAG: hypothetical protein P4L51_03970 [Puia sp.]|nr:hypothetical protein [Puia sp.]
MELLSTEDYKGYTIKVFKTAGSDSVRIFLGDEPVEYDPATEEHYEGSLYNKKGVEAAKQHIDELEEKENSV